MLLDPALLVPPKPLGGGGILNQNFYFEIASMVRSTYFAIGETAI
jgi:hypothetical protein